MAEPMKAREGKIVHFGIPEDLHQKARIQTMKERVTLQALFIKAMEEYMARVEAKEKKA